MIYKKTHKFFVINKTWTDQRECQEILFCKEYFGDNDPYQVLEDRPWFTSYNGIWIRNDCVDSAIVTWFGLRRAHL